MDNEWSGVCEGGRGPAAETCNNVDDDCDGDVDNGFALGLPCTEGLGVCLQRGVTVCDANGGVTCSVQGLPPSSDEICGNGVDDDCDGEASDDVEFTDLGDACSVGKGACLRSGQKVCAGDGNGTVCDATPAPPGAAELCGNSVDDDCDGSTDEGFAALGSACTIPGACPVPGHLQCSADRRDLECVPDAAVGPEALCNGADDDNDQCIDDGFVLGVSCSAGVGACRSTGVTVCNGAQNGTTCNAVAGTPTAERCGNTVDEDCDGSLDNGFDIGVACTSGDSVCQRSGTKICNSANMLTTTCSAVPGAPNPLGELCGNGLDDDCDRSTDEGFTNLGGACSNGQGECRRDGTFVCSADRTTTTCNAVAGTAVAESCDNKDNDCNTVVDNGCDGDNDDYCDVTLAFAGGTITACPRSTSAALLDCNDTNAAINPGATETCRIDAIDMNCDGDPNDGCANRNAAIDNDFDGSNQCLDCDDTNGAVEPGATERRDGFDNNCNGNIDEGFDVDNDGFTTCGTLPGGGVDRSQIDCNDNASTVRPGACELCATAAGTVACGAATPCRCASPSRRATAGARRAPRARRTRSARASSATGTSTSASTCAATTRRAPWASRARTRSSLARPGTRASAASA